MHDFIIQAEGVHKSYSIGANRLHVLRGIDLSIQQGESISMIGASGAGKSTLLHVLGGLDRPDSGKVSIEGVDFYSMNAQRRASIRGLKVGFIFQSYQLLPELTLLENIVLPSMAVRRLGRNEAEKRATALIEQVGLKDRLPHRPSELSGGEQQRAAIARSLMNEPDIILADEPTGNLDSKTGEGVLDYLFHLCSSENRTLVVVTHNEALSARCMRQLTIQDGLLR